MEKQRCSWYANPTELMLRYHDEEWGVPCFDDRRQFEFLVLESAQAGGKGPCLHHPSFVSLFGLHAEVKPPLTASCP